MSDELKPCPFCGGKAEWRSGGPGCSWITCTSCPAETADGSIRRIRNAWNTRFDTSAAQDALICAALEAAAEAAETHFLDAGTTASRERAAGRMIADAIRARKRHLAAIKAKAEERDE